MRIVPVALALCLGASSAGAQDYPCSQIKLVVPYPAGGATDVASRIVAERLDAVFKKPFFVENRGGATGNIGTVAVVTAPPDGCTLLVNATIIATFTDELLQAVLRSVQGPRAGRRHRRHADADRGRPLDPGQRHQGPGRVEQDQARWPQLQHRRLRPAAASRVRGDRAAHRREIHPRRLPRRRHRDDRSDRRAARFRRLPRRHHQAADRERQAQGAGDRRRQALGAGARHPDHRPNRACLG